MFRTLSIGVIATLAVTALGYGVLEHAYRFQPGVKMVLKDDGLYPREVSIAVGDSVTFINKSTHAFWPATDNHPLHNLYEGFDVGRPLKPGDTWAFTFDTEGVWTLHDHLRPYFRGRVVVGDVDPDASCLDATAEMNVAEKQACWERMLSDMAEEEGIKESFALFVELYESDPDFSQQVGCHWMAHKLGETEYGRYLKSGDLSQARFPPETVYCGYGYHHGFIEHLLRDTPEYAVADSFCRSLISATEDDAPRIRLNCYHAIGHGFVPEPDDIETWGDPKKMVAPALTACRNIEENDAFVECLQGAFNVIADWMWNNQFGLYVPQDDPLSVCALFDDRDVSAACYYEVAMRLNPLVDNSIIAAYREFVADIPDEIIAGTVLNSVAASAVGQRIQEDDFSDLVYECRAVPRFLQTDCMKGLTGAFIAHGEPEREYIKAIDFCEQDFLTDDERDVCYWNITRTFKGVYAEEKLAEVCLNIKAPYNEYCAPEFIHK